MSSNTGGLSGGPADEGEEPKEIPASQGPLLLSERPTLLGVSGSKVAVIAPKSPDTWKDLSRCIAIYGFVGFFTFALFIVIGSNVTPEPHHAQPMRYYSPLPSVAFPYQAQQPIGKAPVMTTNIAPTNRALNYPNLPGYHGQKLSILGPAITVNPYTSRLPKSPGPIEVSHNGRLVATALNPTGVGVWDVSSGKPVHIIEEEVNSWAQSLLFSPHDQYLLVGRVDGIVEFWNLKSGRCDKSFNAQPLGLDFMSLSPDGKLLATVGQCNNGSDLIWEIRLWNVQTGALIKVVSQSKLRIISMAFSPDGTQLAMIAGATYNGTEFALWDLRSINAPLRRSASDVWFRGLTFSPDSRELAIGTVNFSHRTFIGPGNRLMVYPDAVGEVDLWDANNGAPLRTIPLRGEPLSVVYGRDGQTLLALEEGLRVETLNLDGKQAPLLYAPDDDHGDMEANVFTQDLTIRIIHTIGGQFELIRTQQDSG